MTKMHIKQILRTLNVTAIYKLAHKYGIDVNDRLSLIKFIREFAPSKKVYNNAYRICFSPKQKVDCSKKLDLPISKVLCILRNQLEAGRGSYTKVLIIGNKNIYWASELYQHKDYNKSIALERNDKNLRVSKLVNSVMFKNDLLIN